MSMWRYNSIWVDLFVQIGYEKLIVIVFGNILVTFKLLDNEWKFT